MSKMRKQIMRIYQLYKSGDYIEAEDMERRIKAERDAQIDCINEEYARLLVPLSSLVAYLDHGEADRLYDFVEAFAPIMLEEVDDAADQMDTKRVYDADEVDALFDRFDNPMCPTTEDQHKAYARLMLSTLKK